MAELKEYYRRRLPHYQPAGAAFFVTFRLTDSLPKGVILELMRERDELLGAEAGRITATVEAWALPLCPPWQDWR